MAKACADVGVLRGNVGPMGHGAPRPSGANVSAMGVTHLLLAHLLALAGLIGGTVEYCEIIQRRAELRRLEADRRAAEASGLRGMVRVFLAEN